MSFHRNFKLSNSTSLNKTIEYIVYIWHSLISDVISFYKYVKFKPTSLYKIMMVMSGKGNPLSHHGILFSVKQVRFFIGINAQTG